MLALPILVLLHFCDCHFYCMVPVFAWPKLLAHETAHHLGGPPHDPDLRWPTWQGQADYWAASEGMPKIFGPAARGLTLRGAKQIASLHAEFSEIDSEPDISAQERSAIFSAGANGENISALMEELFNRMLAERNKPEE